MTGKRVANSFKTLGLFVFLWVILLGLGALLSYGTGSTTWIWVFCAFGLVSTGYAYWNSTTIALRSMKAYPVTAQQAPQLYAAVEDLCGRLEMPMPTIWVAPTKNPNAFATGRDPKHAAVCCTEGILQILTPQELHGVLAHEIMHVYNRDILTASVASALGGIISSFAQIFYFAGGSRNRDQSGAQALGALLAVLIAPMAASLIQLGISRTREYSADADGAVLTGNPMALASALQKIEVATAHAHLPSNPKNDNVAAIMISSPFRSREGVSRLFSTHPPMADRIRRLEQIDRDLAGK